MTEPRDPFDELMRRALAREADKVRPGDDGLDVIRQRIDRQSWTAVKPHRRPWLLTAGAAVLGTAAAVGLFTVLTNDPPGSGLEVSSPDTSSPAPERTAVSPSPETTAQPTPQPTPQPKSPRSEPTVTGPSPRGTEKVESRAVPVYWLGKTVGVEDLGPRLYRTFVPITGRPAEEAVDQMTVGRADDPDYSSAWTGAKVSSVTRDKGVVTVDFSQLPQSRLDAKTAPIGVQQLVYTVQGTLQVQDPVRITENGRAVRTVFGTVDATEPVRRLPVADVQALVWINSPVNNAKVTSPLKVTGVAAAFEATVSWRVRNPDTLAIQEEGFTNAAEGMVHSPYAFVLDLPPGTWEIEVYQASPKDGSVTHSDTKTVVVVEK